MQPNRFVEAKPNPKAEIMPLTEHLQKEPNLQKRAREALTSPGKPANWCNYS